ncbi:hypothetical protein GCM10010344_67120 [Streptomyces bluensis]|nr:hypothetical protein GCM10010344_67120 [Streptomyces bluensis]
MQPLGERDRRRNRTQPVRVVGIRVQQRELQETRGRRLHFGSVDTPGTQSVGVKTGSCVTQLRDGMGMCRF